jgi:hypothetical protein
MPGLFGSTIIEVAIGLSFVFFLLSLICSSINELLAGFLKLRARDLERGIENLLCDPEITKQVLNHPLIKAMGNTAAETAAVKIGAGEGAEEKPNTNQKKPSALKRGWRFIHARKDFSGKPSYIPARAFSAALIDALVPGPGQSASAGDIVQKAKELAGDAEKLTTMLDAKESLGRALLGLGPGKFDGNQALLSVDDIKDLINRQADTDISQPLKAEVVAAKTIDEIRRKISSLPDSPARKAVLDAIAEGQEAIVELRKSVESWFDDSMERVSGVYKRRTQSWLFAISFLVAVFVGADTLRIYDALAKNPSLRTELANQAIRETSEGGQFAPTPTVTAAGTGTPMATPPADDGEDVGTTQNDETGNDGTSNESDSDAALKELEETTLPFGYDDRPWAQGNDSDFWDWLWWSLGRFGGILLTTFAVSLGAPFWFDVLKRFSNLRSAGPSPVETDRQPTQK